MRALVESYREWLALLGTAGAALWAAFRINRWHRRTVARLQAGVRYVRLDDPFAGTQDWYLDIPRFSGVREALQDLALYLIEVNPTLFLVDTDTAFIYMYYGPSVEGLALLLGLAVSLVRFVLTVYVFRRQAQLVAACATVWPAEEPALLDRTFLLYRSPYVERFQFDTRRAARLWGCGPRSAEDLALECWEGGPLRPLPTSFTKAILELAWEVRMERLGLPLWALPGFEMADSGLCRPECRPEFRLENEAYRYQQELFREFEQVGQRADYARERFLTGPALRPAMEGWEDSQFSSFEQALQQAQVRQAELERQRSVRIISPTYEDLQWRKVQSSLVYDMSKLEVSASEGYSVGAGKRAKTCNLL